MVALVYDTAYDVYCEHCGKLYIIMCNRADMVKWLSGVSPIQNALHYISASERELLISGTCGECFDKMFSDLDNDE